MLAGWRCEEDEDLHVDVQTPCGLQELQVRMNPTIIMRPEVPQGLTKLYGGQHPVNDLGALVDLDLHCLEQDRRGTEVLARLVDDAGMTADLGELPWLLGLDVIQPEGVGKLEPRTGLLTGDELCKFLFRGRKRHKNSKQKATTRARIARKTRAYGVFSTTKYDFCKY